MALVPPSPSVLRHIVDVHCHPTDAGEVSVREMQDLGITICAMSSSQGDQQKVHHLASNWPQKVIPAFGYHPWWSHHISLSSPAPPKETHYRTLFFPDTPPTKDEETTFTSLLTTLPDPTPLPEIISTLTSNLTAFPNALLGEVGLDRAFRIPLPPQTNDGTTPRRRLSSFTVPLDHQLAILRAQMELALRMRRNMSIHCVKAQGALVSLLDNLRRSVGDDTWLGVSVDLHSCGLSVETWRDVERKHPNVYLSFSTVINHKHSSYKSLIAAASPDRLLAESDYNDVGKCTSQTWEIIHVIAEVKGWEVEKDWVDDPIPGEQEGDVPVGAVRQLEKNWFKFREGNHRSPLTKKKKDRRQDLKGSEIVFSTEDPGELPNSPQ